MLVCKSACTGEESLIPVENPLSRWQSAFVHSLLITPPSGTGERAASAVDKLRPKPKVSIPFEPITLVCKDIR